MPAIPAPSGAGVSGCPRTDHPREVIEAALAHVVRNRVEAAYARLYPLGPVRTPACPAERLGALPGRRAGGGPGTLGVKRADGVGQVGPDGELPLFSQARPKLRRLLRVRVTPRSTNRYFPNCTTRPQRGVVVPWLGKALYRLSQGPSLACSQVAIVVDAVGVEVFPYTEEGMDMMFGAGRPRHLRKNIRKPTDD